MIDSNLKFDGHFWSVFDALNFFFWKFNLDLKNIKVGDR